jgi:plastocyanin
MKKVAALLALALAAFALVACGDDDDDGTTTATSDNGAETTTEAGGGEKAGGTGGGGGGEAGTALKFEADPGGALAYTTTEASSEAGNVTLEFDNPQAVPHDVAIEDSGGKTVGQTDLITESSTSTSVELKPGSYTFYCSVPGHREAGMEGALTVK